VSPLVRALKTGLGRKIVMAVTGLALIVFLIGHLTGNLLLLFSADKFNTYAHALVSNPLIYVAEAGLIFLFAMHAVQGVLTARANRAARGQRYEVARATESKRSKKGWSSTFMIVSGAVLLIFVPLHVWSFKFGAYYEGVGGQRDLARLVFEAFSRPEVALVYVVALALMGTHLWHGFWSAHQTLGVTHKGLNGILHKLGMGVAVLLTAGFISIPMLILFDVIKAGA